MKLLLFFFIATRLPAATLAIVNGRVFDGTGAPAQVRTVYIDEGRIVPFLSAPEKTLDAAGLTILPGFFDLHTHLAATGSVPGADWGKNLKSNLLNGVTSIVDMSTYPETYEPMRRILALFPSPHDFIAARITTPAGHGDEAGRGDLFSAEVQTPREGRAAVRRIVPYRPDVIKVFTDGWRYDTAPDMTSMDEATLAAIVDEAHKNKLKVITHTVTLARAKIAARAGVDILAHGVGDAPVDAELIWLMRENGTFYVSTLAVFEPKQNPQPARFRRWGNLLGNIKALHDAGVLLACGTDSGEPGTPHGTATLHEMELLVRGGLTPSEALIAATASSARALGVTVDRGTVTPGMRADLVLVEGEPDHDISAIRNTRRVFLNGEEVDLAKLRAEASAPGVTPLPAIEAKRLIDDFEGEPGRTSTGTLRIVNTDPGTDHSQILTTITSRTATKHQLTVVARMAEKDKPFARVLLPLTRGGFEPADASRFKGIRAQVRGAGQYAVVAMGQTGTWTAPFEASVAWHTVEIPFTALQPERARQKWTGKDLQLIGFELAREPGQTAALELDRVEFY